MDNKKYLMFGNNMPEKFKGHCGSFKFSDIEFIANCSSEVALAMAECGLSMQEYAAEMSEFIFSEKPMEHLVVVSKNNIFIGNEEDNYSSILNGMGAEEFDDVLNHVNSVVFETFRELDEGNLKDHTEYMEKDFDKSKMKALFEIWSINPDFVWDIECPEAARELIEHISQNNTTTEAEAENDSSSENVVETTAVEIDPDVEPEPKGWDIIHFLPIIDHEPIQDESKTAKPEVAVTTESEPIIVPATENPEPKPTTTEELINTNKRKCRNYYLSRGLVKKTKKGYTVKFINMDPKKTEFLKLEDVMSKVEELKANLQTMCKQVEVYVTPREFLKSNKTEKQAVREIDAAVKNKYLSLKDIDKAVATFSKRNTYVIDIVAYDDDGAVFKPFCCSIDFIGCIERYKMENGKKVEGKLRPQIFLGASLLLDGEEITNMYRGKEDKNICIIKQIPCSSANIDSIFRQICKSYCDSIVNANPLSIDSYQIQSPAPDGTRSAAG